MLLAGICLILGAGGAAAVSQYGAQLGFLDNPNHRSSHTVATPKGGGVGIVVSFLMVSLISNQAISFWLPACTLSLIGLYGDRVDISPRLRLALQLAAAAITVIGYYASAPQFLTPSLLILVPVWVIFIVGTANFYNFMDGINGIAGLTGCIGFGLMAFFLYRDHADPAVVLLAACICASCLGFLPLNMPKARVFMGDLGSILLGFVFAVLVLFASNSLIDFLCYAALIFPFFIDELTTMVLRIKNGERLTEAHRKHLYQIFANERGVPHWRISCCYALLQLVVGIGVFMMRPHGILAVLAYLFTASICFIVFSGRIRMVS